MSNSRFDQIFYELFEQHVQKLHEQDESNALPSLGIPDPEEGTQRELWQQEIGEIKTDPQEAFQKLMEAFYMVSRRYMYFTMMQQTAINFVADVPGYTTAAVDQSGNFLYSTDFVNKLTREEVAFLVIHEILHLGKLDLFRLKDYVGEKPTQQQMRRWNIAADYINNYWILSDNPIMPGQEDKRTIKPIPGGCFPDNDGVIRVVYSRGKKYDLRPEQYIDLNKSSTETVYSALKDIDDEILDAMEQNMFDNHVHKPSVEVEDIKRALIPPMPKGQPQTQAPVEEPLPGSLIRDKKTGRWGIIISDSGQNTADVILIEDELADEIINTAGGGDMFPPNVKRILDRRIKTLVVQKEAK